MNFYTVPGRMPLTGAERQRRYIEKTKRSGKYKLHKANHAQQVKTWRDKKQRNEELLPRSAKKKLQEKRQEANRKRVAKHRLHKREAQEKNQHPVPFNSASAYAKATARAKRMMTKALPTTPHRRKLICRKLYAAECGEVPPTPSPNIPRMQHILDEVTQVVIEFYQRDDVSRQAPGRKDATTVKLDDGTKTKVQTRHLTSSVMETYALFCKDHPNIKVGKSKFASLRPKHVLLSSKLPHNVCLCQYHENFIVAVNALHKATHEFPLYTQSLPETFLCDPASEDCWLNMCETCRNGQGFTSNYQDVLQETCDASWYVWKKNGDSKLCKVLEEGTTNDLIDHIISTLPQFLRHCYIKRQQAASYKTERDSIVMESDHYDASKALLQVDFSENYTCVAQDEIQSAHWKQNQVSMFTAAFWYCGTIHSQVIVSDNLVHAKETLIAYVDRLLDDLPENVKSVSIWSDGPSSQFKNRFVLASLSALEKNHKTRITWNFFATSHGKGPVDGIGGSVKRHVWGRVSKRKSLVDNAEMFEAAAQSMPTVKVFQMTSDDIEERNDHLRLVEIFSLAPPVLGISRIHHVQVVDGKPKPSFLTRDSDESVNTCNSNDSDVESDEDGSEIQSLCGDDDGDVGNDSKVNSDCENHVQVTDNRDDAENGGKAKENAVNGDKCVKVEVKDWVLVDYDQVGYPGEVVAKEGSEFKVSVMIPAGNHWKWPNPRDAIFYKRSQIICTLNKPVPKNSRGHFNFADIPLPNNK